MEDRQTGVTSWKLDRLKDAIYGLAVGDALGVPYEFRPRDSFHCMNMVGGGTHGQSAGTWSDDTSLTLATLDELIRDNWKINPVSLRIGFKEWLYDGAYAIDGKVFDVGMTVRTALFESKGLDGIMDNGNGSLMRILPLAFVKNVTDEDIDAASSVTHAHEISCRACRTYVHVAQALLNDEPLDDILIRESKDWLKQTDRRVIKSGGYVEDTLHAALWCLINSGDYRSAVATAVNLGGDTDTTAAVTGGLAGIIYGKKSIPMEWLDSLRGKGIVNKEIQLAFKASKANAEIEC